MCVMSSASVLVSVSIRQMPVDDVVAVVVVVGVVVDVVEVVVVVVEADVVVVVGDTVAVEAYTTVVVVAVVVVDVVVVDDVLVDVVVVLPVVTIFPNLMGAGRNPPLTVTIDSATFSGDATADMDMVS